MMGLGIAIGNFLFYLVLFVPLLVILWFIRIFLKDKPKLWLFFSGATILAFIWPIFPGLLIAKYQCVSNSSLKVGDQIPVEGFMFSRLRGYAVTPQYSFFRYGDHFIIRHMLLEKKFSFVEEFVGDETTSGRLYGKGPAYDGEGAYVRHYLAKSDSEHCNGKFTSRLSENQCIATIRSDERVSEYEIKNVSEKSGFPFFINWNKTQIVHIETGKVHAEYNFFRYEAYGSAKYSDRPSLYCYSGQDHETLKSSVLAPILKGT